MFFRTTTLLALMAGVFLTAYPAFADCNMEDGCYGAMAASTWNDSNGRARAAIGYSANMSSEEEADDAAIGQCLESSGGNYCEVVGNFSGHGCGYITVGSNTNGVGWRSGGDASEVYDRCTEDGFDCDWPIGGCNGE